MCPGDRTCETCIRTVRDVPCHCKETYADGGCPAWTSAPDYDINKIDRVTDRICPECGEGHIAIMGYESIPPSMWLGWVPPVTLGVAYRCTKCEFMRICQLNPMLALHDLQYPTFDECAKKAEEGLGLLGSLYSAEEGKK